MAKRVEFPTSSLNGLSSVLKAGFRPPQPTTKKISIVIPFHWMDNWQFFMNRCLSSIENQTFKDYEVVLINHSTMPVTSNRVIESAQGELIKILYVDDYLAHPNSLQEIVDNFEGNWLVTGCTHDTGNGEQVNYHEPAWNDQLYTGVNSVGSPSVLTMKKEGCLLFDTSLSWLLDCDLYKRLHDQYGPPKIVNTPNVVIGIGQHQTTYKLSDEQKLKEHEYVARKHS